MAATLLAAAGRQTAAAILLAVYLIDTTLMQALRIDERDFVR